MFNRGDGQDSIVDSGIGQDRIELGPNITIGDVDFAHGTNPNDLVISIRGTTDRITVANQFGAGGPKIGEIVLKDGTFLRAEDIAALAENHAPTVQTPITTQAVAQNGPSTSRCRPAPFADVDANDTRRSRPRDRRLGAAGVARFDGTTLQDARQWRRRHGRGPADGGDAAGDFVTTDFNVNVTNVNDAPVSTGTIANKRATVGSGFSFQLDANQFVDPDNGLPGVPPQTLTLSAALGSGAALPSWLTFNASTRTFSGTPAAANQGALDIVVTASDGTATATTRFGIFVGTTGNTAPTVGTAIGTQTATEDTAFAFQIPANAFADTTPGDRLRYSATLSNGNDLPSSLTLDPVTGTFAGTPTNANVGSLTVRVTASDIFGASVSTNFTLNVANTNDAPTASGTLDSFITTEDTLFSYTIPQGLFADVDPGDTLTLTARLVDGSPLPAWLTLDSATRTLSGTPDDLDVNMVKSSSRPIRRGGVERGCTSREPKNDAPVVVHRSTPSRPTATIPSRCRPARSSTMAAA